MMVAPASLACLSWVPSWEPSMAPTMMTLAPLVTMALIWFCCSETPPLANWTSALNPAPFRPSLNSFSARTQFSLVFCGSATPMEEFWSNPAAPLLEPPEGSERPQPVSASAAMAATAVALPAVPNIRIVGSLSLCDGTVFRLQTSGFPGDRFLGGGGFVRLEGAAGAGGVPVHVPGQHADNGPLALRLVVDVESDSDQEDQPLDDLGEVGADTQELQAVVEHCHDPATNDGADHGTHAAGHCRAADADCSDGVQLPTPAVKGAGRGGAAHEDHAGQAGQDGHGHHDQEVDLLGLDTGKLCCVAVATDSVDVAANDRARGDEAVDQDQHGQEKAGDGERGRGAARCEQVRGVKDGGADQHQFPHGHPHFGDACAERLGACRGAEFAHDDENSNGDAHQECQVVEPGVRSYLRKVPGAEVLEVFRDGNGVGLAHELVEAAEQEHAGQGDEEGWDADVRGPQALPGSDQGSEQQAQEYARIPGDSPVADGQGDADPDKRRDRTDGEVDVAGDDHQDHADGQDQDVGVAVEEVDDVARSEGAAVGEDLEENDQRNQGEDHAELAGVAAKQLFEGVHGVSPCVRKVLGIARRSGGFSGSGGHQFHQAFLAGLVFAQDTGDGAFEDGVDAVGQAQELGKLRGDNDDALPLVGELLDDAVDLILGA